MNIKEKALNLLKGKRVKEIESEIILLQQQALALNHTPVTTLEGANIGIRAMKIKAQIELLELEISEILAKRVIIGTGLVTAVVATGLVTVIGSTTQDSDTNEETMDYYDIKQ